MSKSIEAAIRLGEWKEARRLIRTELKSNSGSHWLMTRLGLTYYEEHRYRVSMSYSLKALKIKPRCPLVLWDYACCLQMLGKHHMALRIYRRLLSRGVAKVAWGDCGEGLSWARGLLADCFYRQAHSYRALKKTNGAMKSYRKHLSMRGPGCRSIYAIKLVRKELSELL
jgi:tetratricopeptide (TPR) repeat protein